MRASRLSEKVLEMNADSKSDEELRDSDQPQFVPA
jgi:hypothetical protein